MIDFHCHKCNEPMEAPLSLAEKFVDCPKCRDRVRVPGIVDPLAELIDGDIKRLDDLPRRPPPPKPKQRPNALERAGFLLAYLAIFVGVICVCISLLIFAVVISKPYAQPVTAQWNFLVVGATLFFCGLIMAIFTAILEAARDTNETCRMILAKIK